MLDHYSSSMNTYEYQPLSKCMFVFSYHSLYKKNSLRASFWPYYRNIYCLLASLCHQKRQLSIIWSNHGTNFKGASRQLNELYGFLRQYTTKEVISNFCSKQNIAWKFISEHIPHFEDYGKLWWRASKQYLSRVAGDVKLTFEEMTLFWHK